jgi:ATP-binding cassette subfamily F protein 3
LALEVADLTVTVGSHSENRDSSFETRGTAFPEPRTSNLEPRTLLQAANLTIEYGQRVALVGPNGSGKTTLFKAILNHADWESPDIDVVEGPFHIAGRLRTGKSAQIGDYSQIHQHALDEHATLIEWFMRVSGLEYQPATEMLHRFLFNRDDLTREIGTLSGGEKSRLQLARLVHEQVNFLMLDEPTNHLDIQACEQLEEMLDEFDGTLLVISHDRYFLDKLVNRVVELKDQQLVSHNIPFAKWFEARTKAAEPEDKSPERKRRVDEPLTLRSQSEAAKSQSTAKEQREQQKAHQREQHRLRTQLKQLEGRIEKLEAKQSELETQLAEAFQTQGAQKAQELATQFEEVRTQIAGLYEQWEELAAATEN